MNKQKRQEDLKHIREGERAQIFASLLLFVFGIALRRPRHPGRAWHRCCQEEGGKSELEKSKGKQKDEGQMKGKRKKAPSCASYSRVLWSFASLAVLARLVGRPTCHEVVRGLPRALGPSEASRAPWGRLRLSRAP